MFSWHSHTIVRLLLPFAAGTATSLLLLVRSWSPAVVAAVVLLSGGAIMEFVWRRAFSPTRRLLVSGCLWLALFAVGVAAVALRWDGGQIDHFSKVDAVDHLLVRLEEAPSARANSVRATGWVEAVVDTSGRRLTASGRTLIYFETDADAQRLRYGDRIVASRKPRRLEPPKNPHQFDFARMQARQNNFFQVYLPSSDWIALPHARADNLKVTLFDARDHLLADLRRYVPDPDAAAIASALLLGYKADLNDEVRAVYADTGATHVLAVSGLHVGIITLILAFAFGWLQRLGRNGRYAHALILIGLLWGYAALTGFSPSVSRAVLMFSIFTVGAVVLRPQNVYNSIALAAFLLLLFNPFWLVQLGFLLSFSAVVGIVYLYPKISGWLQFRQPLVQGLWEWTAVSLAAQLATFPLIIYVFGQYPIYSLLSNPVAMLGAMVVLVAGLLFIVMSGLSAQFAVAPFETALAWIGRALEVVISAMNACLELIRQLPGALLEAIAVSGLTVLLIYAVMVLVLAFLSRKRAGFLQAALILILIGSLVSAFDRLTGSGQTTLTVYQQRGASVVEVSREGQAVLFTESAPEELNFAIDGNHRAQGIRRTHWLPSRADTSLAFVSKSDFVVAVGDQYWGLLTPESFDNIEILRRVRPGFFDGLIVSENPRLPEDWFDKLHADSLMVVFDDSNRSARQHYWRNACNSVAANCHFTAVDGAFARVYR